jgi:hypothetical protein
MVTQAQLHELKARMERRQAAAAPPSINGVLRLEEPSFPSETRRVATPQPSASSSARPILRLRTTPPLEPVAAPPVALPAVEAPMPALPSTAFPKAVEGTSALPSINGRQRRDAEAWALLMQLAERWPAAFDPTVVKPLKIGIHHDIVAAMLGVSPRSLSHALRQHTRRGEYVAALLTAGTPRIDLEGNACGEVTAEQVEGFRAQRVRTVERKQRRLMQRLQEEAARASDPRSEGRKTQTATQLPRHSDSRKS